MGRGWGCQADKIDLWVAERLLGVTRAVSKRILIPCGVESVWGVIAYVLQGEMLISRQVAGKVGSPIPEAK